MALQNGIAQNNEVKNNGVAPAPAPVEAKKEEKATGAINPQEMGQQIYASLDDAAKEELGSKSHTLHFQILLGLASKPGTRKVSDTEIVSCSTPVGVRLISDIDIVVPVIDVLKNAETGITEEDITFREVKAKEVFDLNYYEFMYLITRPEYAGFCASESDPKGVAFKAKFSKFAKGTAKLPTPTINFKQGTGAIKASILDIDEKGADGKWKIKPQFEERFGALITKRTPNRVDGANKNAVPASTLVSLALQKILKGAQPPVAKK